MVSDRQMMMKRMRGIWVMTMIDDEDDDDSSILVQVDLGSN
jgi:hypothetical protein